MRTIPARYKSTCHECRKPIEIGDPAEYDDATKWIFHPECAPDSDNPKTGQFSAATDGYRAPKKPEELADELGFSK